MRDFVNVVMADDECRIHCETKKGAINLSAGENYIDISAPEIAIDGQPAWGSIRVSFGNSAEEFKRVICKLAQYYEYERQVGACEIRSKGGVVMEYAIAGNGIASILKSSEKRHKRELEKAAARGDLGRMVEERRQMLIIGEIKRKFA